MSCISAWLLLLEGLNKHNQYQLHFFLITNYWIMRWLFLSHFNFCIQDKILGTLNRSTANMHISVLVWSYISASFVEFFLHILLHSLFFIDLWTHFSIFYLDKKKYMTKKVVSSFPCIVVLNYFIGIFSLISCAMDYQLKISRLWIDRDTIPGYSAQIHLFNIKVIIRIVVSNLVMHKLHMSMCSFTCWNILCSIRFLRQDSIDIFLNEIMKVGMRARVLGSGLLVVLH